MFKLAISAVVIIVGVFILLPLFLTLGKPKYKFYDISDIFKAKWKKSNWIFLVSNSKYRPLNTRSILEYDPIKDETKTVLSLPNEIMSISVTSDMKIADYVPFIVEG